MTPQVWFRRLLATFRDRLGVVPLLFVAAALVLSQITLAVDRRLGDEALPRILETTADSADSILSTIAGGLISAVTLLLSLVLLSVQLASSQFSPRTVRDWIGDRTQQRTIGTVVGTVVFCLMALRETGTIGADLSSAPHVSVLVAVTLAVISLVAVVRSVDHLSNSMRIGSVARSLAEETRRAVNALDEELPMSSGDIVAPTKDDVRPRLAAGRPLSLPESGWVKRIDLDSLVTKLDAGEQATLMVGPGTFVYADQPLAWTSGSDLTSAEVEAIFEIGDTRVVDGDVSYGLLQMSDIALRALSPGVNDPNTACDVVVHMGSVLIAVWSHEQGASQITVDGVTIDLMVKDHADYLDTAFAQVLRYAANEFEVLATVQQTIETVRGEVERRDLPGPIEPLTEMLQTIGDIVNSSDLSQSDRRRLAAAAPAQR